MIGKCRVQSPVEEAVKVVESLLIADWYVCTPNSINAATTAPSSSNTCFSVDKVSPNDSQVVTNLVEALSKVFNCNGHQNSNWKEFALETDVSISRSVIGYRGNRSESQLRESLLSPVLSTITQRMTLLPQVDCVDFDSHLLPEQTVRLHDGAGRPASVDYIICLESKERVLKCIPIEAKQKFSVYYLKQLSSYMNKLGTCRDFENKVLVGLLLMEDTFHIAFSPFKWQETHKTVPIVYVSPSIEWRSNMCVSSGGLLLISTMHLIEMDRVEYPPDDLLEEVTKVLYEEPYMPVPQCSFVGDDNPYRRFFLLQQRTKKLEENDKKLKSQTELLAANDRQLQENQKMLEEWVKKEIGKQGKAIGELQELTSPIKKRKVSEAAGP